MTPDVLVDLFKNSMLVVAFMVAAIVMPGLVVGLIISVFQAATQINEQTLSFIPRLLVTFASLVFLSPWLIAQITDFTKDLFANLLYLIG